MRATYNLVVHRKENEVNSLVMTEGCLILFIFQARLFTFTRVYMTPLFLFY